jgi:hypothetical protein
MRIQHSLPIPYLAHALFAPQILLDVGRARRVVELVPVGLARDVVALVLFLAAAAALALLVCGGAVVEEVVFFGGGPVGEGVARLGGGCGGCWWWYCCCCGCRGGGGDSRWGALGKGGLGFGCGFDLRAADGLEAEGWRVG